MKETIETNTQKNIDMITMIISKEMSEMININIKQTIIEITIEEKVIDIQIDEEIKVGVALVVLVHKALHMNIEAKDPQIKEKYLKIALKSKKKLKSNKFYPKNQKVNFYKHRVVFIFLLSK